MADQARMDTVKLNLPAWRSEVTDWDDAKIEQVLDKFEGNINKTVRQFWLQRVNETSVLTDVADVGASRPLSQAYQHAQEMLRYWDRMCGEGGMGSSVGKIKRRYPQGKGLALRRDGGVYVRTD